MNHDPEYWLPANHPYTEHSTYTGGFCSVCRKSIEFHTMDYKLINGERISK
jgi:hypothetical protein